MFVMTLFEYLKSIYERILDGSIGFNEESYFLIKSHDFENLISNDDLCFSLIRSIIDQNGATSRQFSALNRNRASHIVATWLLGIGLAKHFGLNHTNSSFNNLFFDQIWLLSAVAHDYGYFKNELKNTKIDLSGFKEYNLLTTSYFQPFLKCLNHMETTDEFKSYFSYSYDEIKNYFEFSKFYYSTLASISNYEMCDHGIIGACTLFNEYCQKCQEEFNKGLEQSDTVTKIHKIACIIAASHNIFKSDSTEKDKIYKEFGLINLLSTSPIRITKSNNILFLLSLVDTVECTKRFSAKENPKEYLQQKTVLNRIRISEVNNGIVVDFNNLLDYLKNERKNNNMVEKLMKHLQSVDSLKNWTAFKTAYNYNGNACTIST